MHIFYASLLKTVIATESPLNQYLVIDDFKHLVKVENHQNGISY